MALCHLFAFRTHGTVLSNSRYLRFMGTVEWGEQGKDDRASKLLKIIKNVFQTKKNEGGKNDKRILNHSNS